jgi:hypothetical protein
VNADTKATNNNTTLSTMKFVKQPFFLTAAILGGAAATLAQDSTSLDKLEKQNQELKARLDALEDLVKKEGLTPAAPDTNSIKALSQMTISGFVTASYMHDFSEPPGGTSPGYLWDRKNDNFSLNKVKLTFASPPAEFSGDKWDAGYRVSLIFGQDAPIVNTSATTTGFDVVREAYIDLNVPIGTGLNIKAGELISLLNYESGDGGAVNNNFSQGFQWFFTGNPPSAGVQLTYNVTDWLDVKAREQNGMYAGPVDNNQSKTTMIAVDLKPTKKLWFSLVGFGGREDAFARSLWGGSVLGGFQATDKLSFGTELDYFSFYNSPGVTPSGNSPVWSAGLWTAYDFTKKFGAALRAEVLSDKNGVDASGGALGFSNPPGTGQDLYSLAFTLNYRPTPSIKIQPELRYDHSSCDTGTAFGTKNDRVIAGAGVSYLF